MYEYVISPSLVLCEVLPCVPQLRDFVDITDLSHVTSLALFSGENWHPDC